MRLLLLAAPLILGGCFSTAEPVIVTEYIVQDIQTRPRPRPLDLTPLQFSVVTQENLEEFLADISENGSYVFVGMTIDTYESLSLNTNELRRYIEQQQSLIVYYESFENG